jgi:hypothetical protein
MKQVNLIVCKNEMKLRNINNSDYVNTSVTLVRNLVLYICGWNSKLREVEGKLNF